MAHRLRCLLFVNHEMEWLPFFRTAPFGPAVFAWISPRRPMTRIWLNRLREGASTDRPCR
jgi:hypothetical protein